jgi:hypothetical protein
MEKMRPMEGVFDSVCSCELWKTRLYDAFANCTASVLDKSNHSARAPRQNEFELRGIIQQTADLPWDHPTNLRFESEHAFRVACPDPRSFSGLTKKPDAKESGTTGNPKPAAAKNTQANPGDVSSSKGTAAAAPAPRDFGAYAKAGVTVPPKPTATPKYPLCIMDIMGKYGRSLDGSDKTPTSCTRKHDASNGLRPGTKLHYDDILGVFPNRYNLSSAQFQTCNWLSDKPLVAAKIMEDMAKDKSHFK